MKIFILIDAMRSDYISKDNTPFLHSLSEKYFYIKKIKPSLGFCERSEIISGLDSEKTGFFTAIGKNANKSEYKTLIDQISYLLEIINYLLLKIPTIIVFDRKINWSKAYKKYLNIALKKMFSSKMSIYNIPINQLKNFYLTEDQVDHFEGNFYPKTSLVGKILKKNYTINSDSWTYLGNQNQMNEIETRNFLKEKNCSNEKEFLFSYIGTLDVIGHKYGPKSIEMKNALLDVDNFFHDLYQVNKDNTLIILGDHGMKTVENSIDIIPIVKSMKKKFGLKINRDFNFFIDSTILRIWINHDSKEKAINYLKNQELLTKNGKVINVKVSKKEYGDFIWLANEGVMLFPDFFHFDLPSGMHGYDNNKDTSLGTFIVYSKNGKNINIPKANLSDINDIISEHFI